MKYSSLALAAATAASLLAPDAALARRTSGNSPVINIPIPVPKPAREPNLAEWQAQTFTNLGFQAANRSFIMGVDNASCKLTYTTPVATSVVIRKPFSLTTELNPEAMRKVRDGVLASLDEARANVGELFAGEKTNANKILDRKYAEVKAQVTANFADATDHKLKVVLKRGAKDEPPYTAFVDGKEKALNPVLDALIRSIKVPLPDGCNEPAKPAPVIQNGPEIKAELERVSPRMG